MTVPCAAELLLQHMSPAQPDRHRWLPCGSQPDGEPSCACEEEPVKEGGSAGTICRCLCISRLPSFLFSEVRCMIVCFFPPFGVG